MHCADVFTVNAAEEGQRKGGLTQSEATEEVE